MREVEVLIAGAGPAGSTCAFELQKAGRSCLLVDPAEFPRDKICGGGLTPRAWQLMERIHPDVKYDYILVRRMKLYMDLKFKGSFGLKREIRVVRRKDFDNLLLNKYLQAGGDFLKGRIWDVRELEDGRIEATLQSEEKIVCKYLIGADGANSRVRKYLNPASKPDVLIYEQYSPRSGDNDIAIELSNKYKYGYYYVFPNTSADVIGYCEHGSSIEKFREVLKSFNVQEAKALGAYIPTVVDYPSHPAIMLVGDAGCWCDTLSYEGIYFALATGHNAAQAIISGRPFQEVNGYIAARKRHHDKAARLLYNRFGMAMVKLISHSRYLTERVLNHYLR